MKKIVIDPRFKKENSDEELDGVFRNTMEVYSPIKGITARPLTAEEKTKIKCLYALNLRNYSIVIPDCLEDGLFSQSYLNQRGDNAKVYRSAVYRYFDSQGWGSSRIDYNEHFFIVNENVEGSRYISGKVEYEPKTNSYHVTVFKKPFDIDKPVGPEYANINFSSSTTSYPSMKFDRVSQLEEYLLKYDFAEHFKASRSKDGDTYDYTLGLFGAQKERE